MGSTLLTQADCSNVCVWLCVCMVVHLLMCGSQILGYSSVLMLGFKDARYNGRVGCRCVWRARPESLENVRHSRRHIDSYLQMSTYYQSVIFLLPHKGACSQPLKKNHHALADHQNQRTLCPSIEILACQRVINSQIKPTSRRRGFIQEAGMEL